MRKNTKKPISHFRMEEKLAQKLDRRIARAGYQSRSDFFTAVAYVALYGTESQKQPQTMGKVENIDKLPKTVTTWLQGITPRITEEEILTGLHAVIAEMLFAVIAMKGVDVAYENTWADVRSVFHERFGVWVTESDVYEAFVSFAAMCSVELAEYREKQMQGGE